MVKLVNRLYVRKHLRYHFLWEHVVGAVFMVNSKVKDLLKKKGIKVLQMIMVICTTLCVCVRAHVCSQSLHQPINNLTEGTVFFMWVKYVQTTKAGLHVCWHDSQHHVALLLLPVPQQLEWILTCQSSLTTCGPHVALVQQLLPTKGDPS